MELFGVWINVMFIRLLKKIVPPILSRCSAYAETWLIKFIIMMNHSCDVLLQKLVHLTNLVTN